LGGCESGGEIVVLRKYEDFDFVRVDVDAKRRAVGLEGLDDDGKVVVVGEGHSIVEVREEGGLGATAVVAGGALTFALGGRSTKERVGFGKDLVNDKAGEGGRKGVTLREAVILREVVERSVGAVEVAKVGGIVHKMKVREEEEGRRQKPFSSMSRAASREAWFQQLVRSRSRAAWDGGGCRLDGM
jgi:hypothetical protein